MKIIQHEGQLNAKTHRYAIVAARFNSFITDRLVEGAIDTIKRHGGDQDIHVYKVPGCFEIPMAAEKIAATQNFDAIICLGTLIRGGTPHFDYIAAECTKGIAHIGLKHQLPVTYGIITADTLEQAIDRAGAKSGNKGVESALAAIEMVEMFKAPLV